MKQTWGAPERNKEPILAVLRRVLPASGVVFEVASGTGQHVAWFAAALTGITWQPTERDVSLLPSIRAWAEGLPNVLPPVPFDVLDDPWPLPDDRRVDAVLASNLVHISPWEVSEALLRGAAEALKPGGLLLLYGPYRVDGAHTAPSNAAFDADLRARDPRWGVRDVGEVRGAAEPVGLVLEEVVTMPANNLTLVFRRA